MTQVDLNNINRPSIANKEPHMLYSLMPCVFVFFFCVLIIFCGAFNRTHQRVKTEGYQRTDGEVENQIHAKQKNILVDWIDAPLVV